MRFDRTAERRETERLRAVGVQRASLVSLLER
jgi:hypothetical protein